MEKEMVVKNKIENKELEALFHAVFERWNDALKTLDPNEVAKVYTVDAYLSPTLSRRNRNGREEIKDYMAVDFLPKHPVGKIVTIDRAEFLADNLFTVNGLYDFEVGPDDSRHIVNAVYTFICKKNDVDGWDIFLQNSALLPDESPSKN